MGTRRRLTQIGTSAAVVAVALVIAGLVGGKLLADTRSERSRGDLARHLGPAAVALDNAIDAAGEAVAPGIAGAPVNVSARLQQAEGGLSAIGVVRTGQDLTVDSVAPRGGELALEAVVQSPALAADLAAARDTAAVRFAVAKRTEGALLLALSPIYSGSTAPSTVVQRRQSIAGFLVGVLDMDALAAPTLADATTGDGSVAVRGDDLTLYTHNGDPGRGAFAIPLDLPGQLLEVDARADAPVGAAPLGVVLAGLALGIAVLLTGEAAGRARARADELTGARDREVALVAAVGVILQRSLDLAEILPSLSMALADGLDLDGVAILTADDRGELVESFATGQRAARFPSWISDIERPPAELVAGAEMIAPLERAGRAVGALWLIARRGLSPSQVRSVLAVAELSGSAIANSRSYQRELDTARRLHEVDQLKTDFLSTVSHELRTPSTAIKGFSSILSSSWDALDDERRRDLVARIDRNAESLSSMLNGLLDFARIERRSLQIERREVDLAQITQAVVEQTSSLLEEHHIELQVGEPATVWIDPQALERILSNLLTNAAKFSPPGSTITVEVRRARDRVLLTVSDQGPGVPPAERGRIFSRFYRGGSDAAVRTRGAGVGLAVVKELVARLDATITIFDAPGGGARFVVSFPAGIPATSAAGGPHGQTT